MCAKSHSTSNNVKWRNLCYLYYQQHLLKSYFLSITFLYTYLISLHCPQKNLFEATVFTSTILMRAGAVPCTWKSLSLTCRRTQWRRKWGQLPALQSECRKSPPRSVMSVRFGLLPVDRNTRVTDVIRTTLGSCFRYAHVHYIHCGHHWKVCD